MEERPKVTQCNYIIIYPRDMTATCPMVTVESSMSFKSSSLLQVTMKSSPTASKSTQGYRDLKILTVRLTDYLILARIIF
jgi:hypothetical protein